ncbi:MAG: hypothetical protein M1319_02030 [Chloroflexi bacterium]|nr:hypothetical protein [Chloroflexota bacterium]
MAAIGLDCDITLQHANVNGGEPAGFLLKAAGKQKAFTCSVRRVRSFTYTAGGALAYTDSGPGRREWKMTILAGEGMIDHRQAAVSATAREIRTLLAAFYQLVNEVLTFTDPTGDSWSVRFDSWLEAMPDLPATGWEIDITLLEA